MIRSGLVLTFLCTFFIVVGACGQDASQRNRDSGPGLLHGVKKSAQHELKEGDPAPMDGVLVPLSEVPGPSESQIGKVLGTADGMAIGFVEFDREAARKGAIKKSLTEEERKEIVEELVVEKLIYLRAIEQGVHLDPRIQKMVVQTFLKDEVFKDVRNSKITEEELIAYYDEHKDEFTVPERRHLKHMLVKPRKADGEDRAGARARAEMIHGDLQGAGLKDWNALSARHSDGSHANRAGGDYGLIRNGPRPGLDPKVIEATFAMAAPGLGEVFETVDGFNLIYILEIKPKVERTYSQISGSVSRRANAERYKAAHQEFVGPLREAAKVDIQWDAVNAHEIKGGKPLRPANLKRTRRPDAPQPRVAPDSAGKPGGDKATLSADPKEEKHGHGHEDVEK